MLSPGRISGLQPIAVQAGNTAGTLIGEISLLSLSIP